MTRDDVIRMAQQAGFEFNSLGGTFTSGKLDKHLADFAALVAAAARNRTWTPADWTEYERGIAAAEREACAAVCDAVLNEDGNWTPIGYRFSAAIRARGNT